MACEVPTTAQETAFLAELTILGPQGQVLLLLSQPRRQAIERQFGPAPGVSWCGPGPD